MTNLAEQHCVAIRKGSQPLSEEEIRGLAKEVPGWTVAARDGTPSLEKPFAFESFSDALAFTLKVGEAAELENHHPSLTTVWGRVTVAWWTHAVRGLHRNDFIMAAKTDALFGGSPRRGG